MIWDWITSPILESPGWFRLTVFVGAAWVGLAVYVTTREHRSEGEQ